MPAIPGMAPMAAAISGMRPGRNPPFIERRLRPASLRLLRLPEPLMGAAEAVVPVITSTAVAGAFVAAAACAAAVGAVADRQCAKLPRCSR